MHFDLIKDNCLLFDLDIKFECAKEAVLELNLEFDNFIFALRSRKMDLGGVGN